MEQQFCHMWKHKHKKNKVSISLLYLNLADIVIACGEPARIIGCVYWNQLTAV